MEAALDTSGGAEAIEVLTSYGADPNKKIELNRNYPVYRCSGCFHNNGSCLSRPIKLIIPVCLLDMK